MPVTINVNRLSLVHETSEGVSSATLPNVCATPDVGLVPYPSTAFSRDLAGGTRDVVADGGSSIAVRGSIFAVSSGDEPGTLGGVVSRLNGAESRFLSWSLDVKIEGRNACRLTDKMLHNHGNTINCGGVVQPVLRARRRRLEAPTARAARVSGYSLEVDVFYQTLPDPKAPPPDPNAPPPAPLPHVPVDKAGVEVSIKKNPPIWQGKAPSKPKKGEKPRATTAWQGNTHPDKKLKNPLGTWTLKKIKAGRYYVHVNHDCLAEATIEQDASKPVAARKPILGHASVKGRPTKYTTWMIAPDLRKAANEKGVILGGRMDYPRRDPKHEPTVLSTFNDVIDGTFLASRCPDHLTLTPLDPAKPSFLLPINRDLVDLTTQQPVYDFAPGQAFLDKVAQASCTVDPVLSYTNTTINFAQPHSLQIMVTPLVWPGPANTPGWPCGTPLSHRHPIENKKPKPTDPPPPEHIPFEHSYVYRRTLAQNKLGDAAAERKAAMEVHRNFIHTVINRYKGLAYERPAFPGTAAQPWYVVVNECLNMRYSGAQANGTADKDLARDHPLWQRFGLWDVDESKENLEHGIRHGIKDKTLWRNIRDCFVEAYAASDGQALLILNDYSVESFHPDIDYNKLRETRDQGDRPIRARRQKAWDAAAVKVRTADHKARKARKSVDEKKRPAAKYPPDQAYSTAVAAAEVAFDNAVNAAFSAYVSDVQAAEDISDGIVKSKQYVDKDDQYRKNLKDAEKKYGDAVGAAKTAYTAAVNRPPPTPPASAETTYQAAHAANKAAHDAYLGARDAALAAQHASEAANDPAGAAQHAKEAANATALAKQVYPDSAAAEHKALQRDAEDRYKAAGDYHKAVHAAKKLYWKSYHRAQITYHEEYAKLPSERRKASGIYDTAEKPQLFYRLVEWLVKDKEGLPPEVRKKLVIGFQMHYPKNPTESGYDPDGIARNMRRYARLHLPVVITELDVSHEGLMAIHDRPATNKKRKAANKKNKAFNARYAGKKDKHGKIIKARPMLKLLKELDPLDPKHQNAFMGLYREQAERFRELMEACLSCGNCLSIATWGVADYPDEFRYLAYWFHPTFTCPIPSCPGNGPSSEYWRKPAYAASVSAFLRAPKQFTDDEIRSGKAAAKANAIAPHEATDKRFK